MSVSWEELLHRSDMDVTGATRKSRSGGSDRARLQIGYGILAMFEKLARGRSWARRRINNNKMIISSVGLRNFRGYRNSIRHVCMYPKAHLSRSCFGGRIDCLLFRTTSPLLSAVLAVCSIRGYYCSLPAVYPPVQYPHGKICWHHISYS